MGRYLLLALLVFCGPPTAAGAMDIDDMLRLPGAELLPLRANEVVERLGPPAAIRDHGANQGLPRQKVRLGSEQASLSDESWNLIYGRLPSRNVFEWVNPQPGAPKEMQGLDTLVIYTHPDGEILDFDQRTGQLSMRRAADELEKHAIYGIASIPSRSIPWAEFVRKWGQPDEATADEKAKPVSRYWVPLEIEEVPVALFAVDAMRGPSGDVLSIAIYNSRTGFVAERLQQMWEESRPEGPNGRGGEGPPGEGPPGGGRPDDEVPDLKAAPGWRVEAHN